MKMKLVISFRILEPINFLINLKNILVNLPIWYMSPVLFLPYSARNKNHTETEH